MQTGGLGSVIGGAGVDPFLPFRIVPMNGCEARESGLRLKASVAPGAGVSHAAFPNRLQLALVRILSGAPLSTYWEIARFSQLTPDCVKNFETFSNDIN